MRPLLMLALLALVSGCASPDDAATEASNQPPDEQRTGETKPVVTRLPPIDIEGILTSAGGCPEQGYDTLPQVVPGDVQAVPQEAWSRGYDGPTMGSVPTAIGAICTVWLDDAGAVLGASFQEAGGTVPNGATQVLVRGNLQVEVPYTIRVT